MNSTIIRSAFNRNTSAVFLIFLAMVIVFCIHIPLFAQEAENGLINPSTQNDFVAFVVDEEISEKKKEVSSETIPYVMGEILIQYDEALFHARINELENNGAIMTPDGLTDPTSASMSTVPINVADEFLAQQGIKTSSVVSRIESLNTELIDIKGIDPMTVIDQLKANPVEGIVFAQPNFIYTSTQTAPTTSPDPQRNTSWHLKAIQLQDAWDVRDATSQNPPVVTVGLIDGGVDFSNDDLENAKWTLLNCKDENGSIVAGGCLNGGYNVVDSSDNHDNNPTPRIKKEKHGTRVASVLAGEYNNGYGVIGVAQGIKIVSIRAGAIRSGAMESEIETFRTVDVIEAIDFARENEIDIINLSFTKHINPSSCDDFTYIDPRDPDKKTDMFFEYAALKKYGEPNKKSGWRGGIAVAGAGNIREQTGGGRGNRVVFPADFSATVTVGTDDNPCWEELDNVISVGGTELNNDGTEEIWVSANEGSSRGNHIDIAAPAAAIPAEPPKPHEIFPLIAGKKVFDGTSYASPQVAGVAALMLQVNSNLTPVEVKRKIKNSADEIESFRTILAEGHRLNAYRAVKAALGQPTEQISPLPIINSTTDPLTTSLPPLKPTSVFSEPGDRQLTVSWAAAPNATSYEIRWRSESPEPSPWNYTNIGNVTKHAITNLTNNTKYTVHVRGRDATKVSGQAVIDFGENTEPVATVAPENLTLTPGDQQLTASWDAVPNATGYQIRYRTEESSPFENNNALYPWISVTNTTHAITSLMNNKKHHVQVRTVTTHGYGAIAEIVFTDTTIPAALPAPTNVSSVPGYRGLTISWDAVPNATGYQIRWHAEGSEPLWQWYLDLGNVTTFTIGGLDSNTQYIVHLRAKNADGAGVRTEINSSKSTKPILSLSAPTNASSTPGDRQLTISWDEVANARGYQIRWHAEGLRPNPLWRYIDVGNVTTYTITGLTNGTRHIVHIRAKDFDGAGAGAVVDFSAETIPADPNPSINGGTDSDGDGLIEITNATELLNIRHSIGTKGYKDGPDGSVSTEGCPKINSSDNPRADLASQCTGFELVNNIDLAGVPWVPIGTQETPFNLIFHGNNYTVSNISLQDRYMRNVGFIGYATNATIRNLGLRDVNLVGGTYVGGIVGQSVGSAITNSYVTGFVFGRYYSGGIVGLNSGTVTNSYAAVVLIPGEESAGGISGSNTDGTIISSYHNKEISRSESQQDKGRTFIQLRKGTPSNSIYTNWSTDIWDFGTTDQMPILRGSGITPISPRSDDVDKDGFVEIATVADLQAVRKKIETGCPSANCSGFKLTNNLNLAGIDWTPIGTYAAPFSAIFDGNGRTIFNVSSQDKRRNRVGLFGYGNHSIIRDLKLSNVNFVGRYNVGGLIGYDSGGTITNSHVTGFISGRTQVGGLIGRGGGTIANSSAQASVSGSILVGGLAGGIDLVTNSHTNGLVVGHAAVGGLVGSGDTISNSYSITPLVIGDNEVGGLVGRADTITNSYATSMVSGRNYIGGLVGLNFGGLFSTRAGRKIINSYATGPVIGSDYVGGLVGINHNGVIINSYATGLVTGNSNAGGLVGGKHIVSTITNSYWDKQTTGQATSVGSRSSGGKTTAEMKSGTPSTTIYTNWDTNKWDFGTTAQYPTLKGVTVLTLTISPVSGGHVNATEDDNGVTISGTTTRADSGSDVDLTFTNGSNTVTVSDITVSSNAWSTTLTLANLTILGEGTISIAGTVDNTAGRKSTTSRSFVYDITAPTATASGAPTGTSAVTTLKITVAGTDVTHYKHKVVAGSTCSGAGYGSETPIATAITDDISSLADGSITLCVLGRDAAGNWQTAATSATWTKGAGGGS